MENIKILLFSDLHLGIEKTGSLITEDERLCTFRRIMSLAQKHDIILIAGDLVDSCRIDSSYFDILKEEFSKLKESGREIYYTPGSGELSPDMKLNPAIAEIESTFTFSDEKDVYLVKSSFGDIFIYGIQHQSSNKDWKIVRTDTKGFHIGLFHADFNPQGGGSPETGCIKKNDMKKMNLDFYALGKNHNFKMYRFSNKILGASSGSPEPCSIDETGDRFVVSMEVAENTVQNIKRISVNTGKIHTGEIDCGTIINQNALIDKIRSTYPEKSIVNITLSGERDFPVGNSLKNELSGFFRGLKISDMSIPTLKILIDENTADSSLNGFFFRILGSRLENDTDSRISRTILAGLISDKYSCRNNGGVICDF